MAGISPEFILVVTNLDLALCSLVLLIALAGSYFTLIYIEEKNKVEQMPRKPMTICDKHGPYPSELTLSIDAFEENKPDLVVNICPICYSDRLKIADRKLAS